MFICSWPSLDVLFDKQIVMTGKAVEQFLGFCFAVKHGTVSGAIN
jgi:hypothetical protein